MPTASTLLSESTATLEVLHQHGEGCLFDLAEILEKLFLVLQLRQVEGGREVCAAALRQVDEVRARLSALLRPVELRTVDVLAFLLVTRVSLEDFWVILKFFPAVAVLAVQAITARVSVLRNLILRVPRATLVLRVGIEVGLAAKVLPVVRVHADFPLVVLFLVWAPRRLEMKHVKVCITIESLDEVN